MEKNLKTKIKDICKRQTNIDKLIKTIIENWDNELVVVKLFLDAPDYCLSHPRIISILADFLQCINNKQLLSGFELHDIENLYKLNINTLPDDVSQYVDLAYFYNSVINDEEKASNIIDLGLEMSNNLTKKLIEVEKNLR